MEQYLRKLFERLGASLDGLVGKGTGQPAAEDLIAALCQAIERNVIEDRQGVRRIVPAHMIIALSYEAHAGLTEEARKAIRQELTAVAESYIHDHRYVLPAALVMEVTCDPFLRQPFEVRISAGSAAVPGRTLWLVSEQGRKIKLDLSGPQARRRLTLGRSGDNDITIDDPTVSRFHAALTLNQRGELIVSDLGSANGTFVNGQRVGAWRIVQPNDELAVGSALFRLKEG